MKSRVQLLSRTSAIGLRRALACAALLLASCVPGAEGAEDGRLRVVATTGMVADAVERIAGDRVHLYSLMGPGIDPHLYKATAGDVRAIAGADLILYNGLHLEAATGEVLAEMGRRTRTVAIAESIPVERRLATDAFGGAYDPHVWFDVSLWSLAVRAAGEALAEADTANAAYYLEQTREYLQELAMLHEWVREQIQLVPPERRVLVTAHDAFGYFGRAYGVQVEGLQGISTATEAGTADVRRLATLIATRGIPCVFVETSIPRRTIEAVRAAARSLGADVMIGEPLFSDALGTGGTPEGTYVGMVRHNVRAIVQGLTREAVS
jgi:manganese/zinc/iron transport system substrate-binding protein